MRTRAVLLLALVSTCLGTGSAGEAHKCLPGDNAPSCEGQDTDADVLLQSRVVREDDGAVAEEEGLIDEDELLQDKEEGEEDDGVQVSKACDPCDTACLKGNYAALFQKCDADRNSRLTANEVQQCLTFTEKPEDEPEDASLSELESRRMTTSGAAEWIAHFDEDKDSELTRDEFEKSMGGDTCETSLLEEKQTSEEDSTGSCDLGQIWNAKCFTDKVKKGCFLEGDEVRGRWGKAKKAVSGAAKKVTDCVESWVDVFTKCVTNVKLPSFSGCFNHYKSQLLGSKWSNVFPSCSNANDCKNKLLNINLGFDPNDVKGEALGGANQVTSAAGALFKQIAEDVYAKAKGDLDSKLASNKGGKMVMNYFNNAKPMAEALAEAGGEIGTAIGEFVVGSAKQIHDYNIVKTWCSKDAGNFGFWYFKPTDCGAFAHLTEAFSMNSITKTRDMSGWNSALNKWKNALQKFGGALGVCAAKRSIMSLPTPFIDLGIANWCVPQPLRIIINGVLGTFQYVFDQVGAAANGCKDNSQPVCKLTKAVVGASEKLVSNFKASFLQDSAAIVGEKLHGDATRYTADCQGEDFKIFVLVKLAVRFPPWNDKMSLGVKFANGCKDSKYFWDILINVAGSLFIAGYVNPAEFFPSELKKDIVVDVGFDVGDANKDWNTGLPGTDIVQWMGGFTIAASVKWGSAVFGLALTFKMLPSPDYPKGFVLSPKFGVKPPTALLIEDGQKEIDEAVADAADPVDATLKATGAALTQMAKLDLNQKPLMSLIGDAASEMANAQAVSVPPPEPDSLALFAGLSVDFCLSCGAK